jgi:hypothetical protein
MSELLLDRAGRRRSPATFPEFHASHAPGDKGLRYPADPPKVEEIVAVMRAAGDRAHGQRLRGLIAILWRHPERATDRSAVLRHQWHDARAPLVTRRGTSRAAAYRRGGRSAAPLLPHQLRHAHAVEMARVGVPLIVIQRQVGHSNLGITSVYLHAIWSALPRCGTMRWRRTAGVADAIAGSVLASCETDRDCHLLAPGGARRRARYAGRVRQRGQPEGETFN